MWKHYTHKKCLCRVNFLFNTNTLNSLPEFTSQRSCRTVYLTCTLFQKCVINMKEHLIISQFVFVSDLSPLLATSFFLFPLLIILLFSSHGFRGDVQLLFESGAVLCKQQPGWSKIVKFMWFIWPDQFLTAVISLLTNVIKMDSCYRAFFKFDFNFALIQYIAIHYICIVWHQRQ